MKNMEFMKKPIWDYEKIIRIIRRRMLDTDQEPIVISSDHDIQEIKEVEHYIEEKLAPSFITMSREEFLTYLKWVRNYIVSHGNYHQSELDVIDILTDDEYFFVHAFFVTDASYMNARVAVFFDLVDIKTEKIVPFSNKHLWRFYGKSIEEIKEKMHQIIDEYGCLPITIHTFYRPFDKIGSEANFIRLANKSAREKEQMMNMYDDYI